MEAQQQEIHSLKELIEVADNLVEQWKEIWWRGHSQEEWRLVPGVHRRPANDEHNLASLFRARSVSRREGLPGRDDIAGWLLLMQHHGLPTRLLDWTESCLIATYFAVTEDTSMPAAIWGMAPFVLNANHAKQEGLPQIANPELMSLMRSAFLRPKTSEKIMAFLADEVDIRMLVQSSRFTIHDTRTPMEDLIGSDQFLVKIQVPVKAKPAIRSQLARMGVTESHLFPDLDHLAHEVKGKTFRDPAMDIGKEE